MNGHDVDRWVSLRLAEYLIEAERDGYESLHGAVSFVLRALVNPVVPESGRMVDEIVAERVRREAEATA